MQRHEEREPDEKRKKIIPEEPQITPVFLNVQLVSDKITLAPLEGFRSRLSPTVSHLPPYRIVMSENKVYCVSSLNRGADRSRLFPLAPRS